MRIKTFGEVYANDYKVIKKYIKDSERYENYLTSKGYNPIQTKQILVKDFYKPIKQESANWNVFLLGEDQGINVVTNHYKP